MLLSECATEYIEINRPYLKERTIFTYIKKSKSIVNVFGDIDINTFTQEFLQNFINEEQSKEKSKSSVKRIVSFLILILKRYKHFDKFKYIITDKDNKEKKVYSVEDIEKIEKYIIQHNKKTYIPIMIAINTGMRVSEITGLKWCDIDFENRIINVCRNATKIGSEEFIDLPKTNSGKRKIPINETLYNYLKKQHCNGSDCYVITNNLKVKALRTVQRTNETLCKKLGIEYCGMHAYRHAFATRLLKASQDHKAISQIMGHSSIAITQNIYNHPSNEQYKNVIECAFGGQEKKEEKIQQNEVGKEELELMKGQIYMMQSQIAMLQNQVNLLTMQVENHSFYQSLYIKPKFRVINNYGKNKDFVDKKSLLADLDISSQILTKHLNGCETILDELGVWVQKL